jgi:hypothetical protein
MWDRKGGRGLAPGKSTLTSQLEDAPVPGKRTLVEGIALPKGEARPPDVADVATEAIAHKGAGSSVPESVRTRVEPAVGADLSNVRVHDDSGARQATGAMGARAFAHGADVFLAPARVQPTSGSWPMS